MSKFTIGDLYKGDVNPDANFMLLRSKLGDVEIVCKNPFALYNGLNNPFVTDDNIRKVYVSYFKKLNGMEDVFVLNLINSKGSDENTIEVLCASNEIDRVLYGATNAGKGDLSNVELNESMHTNEEYVMSLYTFLLDNVREEEKEMW